MTESDAKFLHIFGKPSITSQMQKKKQITDKRRKKGKREDMRNSNFAHQPILPKIKSKITFSFKNQEGNKYHKQGVSSGLFITLRSKQHDNYCKLLQEAITEGVACLFILNVLIRRTIPSNSAVNFIYLVIQPLVVHKHHPDFQKASWLQKTTEF